MHRGIRAGSWIKAGIDGSVPIQPDDVGITLARHAKATTRHHLLGPQAVIERQGINRSTDRAVGIEGGIQRAVGFEQGNIVAGGTVDMREVAGNQHFAIGQDLQGTHRAIGTGTRVKGGVQRTIRVEPGDAGDQRTIEKIEVATNVELGAGDRDRVDRAIGTRPALKEASHWPLVLTKAMQAWAMLFRD